VPHVSACLSAPLDSIRSRVSPATSSRRPSGASGSSINTSSYSRAKAAATLARGARRGASPSPTGFEWACAGVGSGGRTWRSWWRAPRRSWRRSSRYRRCSAPRSRRPRRRTWGWGRSKRGRRRRGRRGRAPTATAGRTVRRNVIGGSGQVGRTSEAGRLGPSGGIGRSARGIGRSARGIGRTHSPRRPARTRRRHRRRPRLRSPRRPPPPFHRRRRRSLRRPPSSASSASEPTSGTLRPYRGRNVPLVARSAASPLPDPLALLLLGGDVGELLVDPVARVAGVDDLA
jgi:hypothetical protein